MMLASLATATSFRVASKEARTNVAGHEAGPAQTDALKSAQELMGATYVPAFTCATASAISSADLARTSASLTETPLALRSPMILAIASPGPSNSDATTCLA